MSDDASVKPTEPTVEKFSKLLDLDAYRASRVADGTWPESKDDMIKFWQWYKKYYARKVEP